MFLINFSLNNNINNELTKLENRLKTICNKKQVTKITLNKSIMTELKQLDTKIKTISKKKHIINFTLNKSIFNDLNRLNNNITNLNTKKVNIGVDRTKVTSELAVINNTTLGLTNKQFLIKLLLNSSVFTQLLTLRNQLTTFSNRQYPINLNPNTTVYKQKMGQVKQITGQTFSYIDVEFREVGDEATTAGNKVGNVFTRAFEKIKTSLSGLTSKVHNIKVALTGSEAVMNNLNKIKNGINQMGTGIRQLGMYSAMLFTPAIREAEKDEKYFAKFNTLALKTEGELKKYVNLFKKYGKEIGAEAGQVANMAAEYLSAGGTNSYESIKGFLTSTLATAKVGYVQDWGEYARTVKVIANNLGVDSAEAYKAINDNIITIQNRGVITADQYGQYATSAYPLLHSVGMEFSEFNALLSLASIKMANPSTTMTGLRQFASDISGPTKSAKEEAKRLGVEIDARAFRKKGALKYFQDIKKAIEATGDVVDSVSIDRLFGNTRSKTFVNAILQDLDQLDTELKAFKKGDTLDTMLDNYLDSPISKLERAKETLRSGFSSLGSNLIPVFAEIMTSIAGVMEKVTAWIEQHPVLFQNLVKLGAILLGLATVGLVVKSVFLILGGAWQVVSGVAGLFMGVIKKVRTMGLIPFMGSMLKWIAIIGAVVYALWFLHHNFGSVWNGIGAVFKTIAGGLLTGIELILGALELLIQGLAFTMQKFDPFTQGVRAIGNLVGNDTMANFKNPFALLTQGLAEGIGSAKNAVGGLANKLQKEVKDAIVTSDKKLDFNPFENIGWKWPDNLGDEAEQSLQSMLGDINPELDWGDLVPDLGDGIGDLEDASDKYKKAMETLRDETKKWIEDFENSIKMFEKVNKKVVNSASLLKNAKDRATQMEELRIVKEQLQNRGLDEHVMTEISKMGVDKLAELKALNRMSDTDLKQWNNYTTSTRDDSMAMAQQTVTNIYVTAGSDEINAKKIANEIYKELKRKGVKIV